jgi:hypothetical protein
MPEPTETPSNTVGICRLAVVPVRKEPAHTEEQITQLLFGDAYEVLAQAKHWLRIRIATDRCEGWIDEAQHHAISREYFDAVTLADFKITTDVASGILYKKSPLTVVLGSIVPISASELFKMEEQFAFNGESKSLGQKRDVEFVKTIALKYLNAPFQWGGKTPFGIDAPGLIQMVYKIAGYFLPRDLSQQAGAGKKIKSLGLAHAADIIFFSTLKHDTPHAGIFLGDDKILHACGRVRIDHLNEEGILDADTRIYTHHLSSIRRIVNG